MVSESDRFVIEAAHRRGPPKCPPNPAYPNGIDVNAAADDGACCKVALPYPAPERLVWMVTCKRCGFTAGVTAAGRPDDPRSVMLPCKAPPLPSLSLRQGGD